MILSALTKFKYSLAKGWLVTILLVSLFSVTGFDSCQSYQKQITNTEQVVSFNRTAKRTHTFKKTFSASPQYKNSSPLAHLQITAVIQNLAKHLQVEERTVIEATQSFRNPTQYFRSAFIPRSSDEDHFNSFRG